jgi:hypothetical protein
LRTRPAKVAIAAEVRLGEELAKLPPAKGTRGQIRKGAGRVKGGAVLEPPISGPSLKELSARSRLLGEALKKLPEARGGDQKSSARTFDRRDKAGEVLVVAEARLGEEVKR